MDIISHFNELSLSKFHLDISKFVSLPNLSWNAWLPSFEPSFEIHNVKHIEQFNLFQSAERGGLSQCRMPWVKTNVEEGRAIE
jgi:hypothetical protein